MELVISFSGGKDSCAMLAYLCETYPDLKKHVVFADTGWEHKDVVSWCESITAMFGLPLHIVKNPNKTFLTMVEKRKMFPSAQHRQCTSDLKRGPIETWIRRNVKDAVVINCMGMRSEESSSRAKRLKLKRNKSNSNNKRTVWDWLPIKDWSETFVRNYLKERCIPLHPVYQYLNRFSCRVCIFMSDEDLNAVRKHDPEAIQIISKLEKKINFSMKPTGFLK